MFVLYPSISAVGARASGWSQHRIMSTLPKCTLGFTGLEVSVLGYGASALGSVFDEGMDVEEGIRSVHEALRLGINYFDTSPFYGVTKSEQVLGRALTGVPRSSYVLSTKAGRINDEEFDFSADGMKKSVKDSLQRLGVDYFDIVLCHDIEFVNLDQIINEALPALKDLKENGVLKFVGISGLPLKAFHYVLDRVSPGDVDVVLSYCHNTLFDDSLLKDLPYFKSKQVSVIDAASMSMGLLSSRGPPSWHPANQETKQACSKALEICNEKGFDLPKLAVKHSLSCSDVPVTLISMPTRQQVQENVAGALEACQGPSASEAEEECLRAIKKVLLPVKNATWISGLPGNN